MKFKSQHPDWQGLVWRAGTRVLPRSPRLLLSAARGGGHGAVINTHRDAWSPPHLLAAQLPALRSADKCDRSSMDKLNYLHSWSGEKPHVAQGGEVTSQPRPWAAPSALCGSEEHAALRQSAPVPAAGRCKTAAEAADEWVGVMAMTTQRPLLQLSWSNTALGLPPSFFCKAPFCI